MNRVSIVLLIILGLLGTGCSITDKPQDEFEAAKEKITEEDQAEVLEIMNIAFIEKNTDRALKNSFKDLETLRKIKVAVEADTLEETREIIISKYKNSLMFENRSEFLNRFQTDTIEVYEENARIVGTIDIDVNGEMHTTKYIFVQNENGEWYDMEELLVLAKELEINLDK